MQMFNLIQKAQEQLNDPNVAFFVSTWYFKMDLNELFLNQTKEIEPEVEKESAIDVNITGKKLWKMSLGNTLGNDSFIYDHCIETNELRSLEELSLVIINHGLVITNVR